MKTSRVHRIVSACLAGALLPAAVGAAILVAPGVAEASVKSAKCRVHEILARKDGDGVLPSDLEFLRAELESDQFAAYKTFRLLDAKDFAITIDKAKSSSFRSGHRLGLKLLGGELERPRVSVVVEAPGRDKPSVSADYTIQANGFLLLAGFKHDDGRIIFAIQCEAK